MSKTKDSRILIETILEGIHRIKGKNIIHVDLESIHHTECGHFIICHGTSSTHVDSIAHTIEETVKEIAGEDVWHRDGYRNAIWILLDYGDVMVHVFQEEARQFYNLEGLWADAKINKIEDEE
ncbi:MAG TPA: ribosome silencing factor [Draconibacterium sp.]|nr:ribosome silencing factor [Draconibacterium sp.]